MKSRSNVIYSFQTQLDKQTLKVQKLTKQITSQPEFIAISLVYFVQGILGLSRLAIQFYFKDELKIDPGEASILMGLSTAPWLIKPLYGIISDTKPIFGYKRRSYLFICGLLGASSWFILSNKVSSIYFVTVLNMFASLSVAFSDVVIDSVVVERARGEDQGLAGNLQSLCWASASFGSLVTSYYSGYLIEHYGTAFVFRITALFPLLITGASFLIREDGGERGPKKMDTDMVMEDGNATKPVVKNQSKQITVQMKEVLDALLQKRILYPTIFVFLYQATPSLDSAMFYFYTNKLHLDAEFLGVVKFVGAIANLLGIALYKFFLKDVPLKTMFFWTIIIGTVLSFTQIILVTGLNHQLGLDDRLFCLGDSLILRVIGEVSFMPILVLAARICPEGVEASLYATLMSIMNGGSVVAGLLGAGLTKQFGITSDNFDNLAVLVFVCTVTKFAPIAFLNFVPEKEELDQDAKKSKKAAQEEFSILEDQIPNEKSG